LWIDPRLAWDALLAFSDITETVAGRCKSTL
jgi:hypothetical protein